MYRCFLEHVPVRVPACVLRRVNRRELGVRARFAPSPTGSLHLGGARTALFNYVLVRGAAQRGDHEASLVVRIDDTDSSRIEAGSEAGILRDLAWLGIAWNEGPDVGGEFGPYRASERLALYARAVERLVDDDVA